MSDLKHGFDEALLSGYLDGELTQGEEQRVRLHLEDCAECRTTTDELQKLRKATMETSMNIPNDTQWDEAPRGGLSTFLGSFGWLIAVAWVIGLAGYGIWQVATNSQNLFEAVVVFGLWLGFGLVFLSVLIDRLKTRKTDPYRRIEK